MSNQAVTGSEKLRFLGNLQNQLTPVLLRFGIESDDVRRSSIYGGDNPGDQSSQVHILHGCNFLMTASAISLSRIPPKDSAASD